MFKPKPKIPQDVYEDICQENNGKGNILKDTASKISTGTVLLALKYIEAKINQALRKRKVTEVEEIDDFPELGDLGDLEDRL